MRKVLIILLIIPVLAFTQTTKALDFVAPMYDGVAAIKKDNSWGFVNDKGAIIIDFRNDLVLTKFDDGRYPIFKDGRCLISEKKAGITYFGYIDKKGETIIQPKFLNASNFDNDKALVLHVIKEKLGKNELLGKNIVYHRYYEVTIDTDGNIKDFLNPKGINIALDKKFLRTPPKITSEKISNNLYAVLDENKKWSIVSINN
ncbi:WG repeat-containing protein [Changchengzhania lutea]|uniref:WG repeat-containing protein n=1 Tax=Changchengzhania lutea TaxID=2049305 RepID=UPI00115CA598|nr:WG repeat-containing protein [Changchengzhania lutea]